MGRDGSDAKAEKTWIGGHPGVREVQALASRAHRAANERLQCKRGLHRFKGTKGRGSGLRWTVRNFVDWGDLAPQSWIDPDEPWCGTRRARGSAVSQAQAPDR